jgi:hypothetical protein
MLAVFCNAQEIEYDESDPEDLLWYCYTTRSDQSGIMYYDDVKQLRLPTDAYLRPAISSDDTTLQTQARSRWPYDKLGPTQNQYPLNAYTYSFQEDATDSIVVTQPTVSSCAAISQSSVDANEYHLYSHDFTQDSYDGGTGSRSCIWVFERVNGFDATVYRPDIDSTKNRPGIFWPTASYQGSISTLITTSSVPIGDYLEISASAYTDQGTITHTNRYTGGYGSLIESGRSRCTTGPNNYVLFKNTVSYDCSNVWTSNENFNGIYRLEIKFFSMGNDKPLFRTGFHIQIDVQKRIAGFKVPVFAIYYHTEQIDICDTMNARKARLRDFNYFMVEGFNTPADEVTNDINTKQFRAVKIDYQRNNVYYWNTPHNLATEVWCTRCKCKDGYTRPPAATSTTSAGARRLQDIKDRLADSSVNYQNNFWNPIFSNQQYDAPSSNMFLGSETVPLRYVDVEGHGSKYPADFGPGLTQDKKEEYGACRSNFCDPGTVSDGSTNDDGSAASKSTRCVPCAAGKYGRTYNLFSSPLEPDAVLDKPGDEDEEISLAFRAVCAPCPVDTYSAIEGYNGEADFATNDGHFCTVCPAHTTTHDKNGQKSCSPCAQGTYRLPPATYEYTEFGTLVSNFICTSCDQNALDNNNCCDVGNFMNITDATCTNCPSGTYQDEQYSYECKFCTSGKQTEFAGAAASSDCLTCPAGKFQNGSMAKCQDCEFGKISANGQPICVECPSGKIHDSSLSGLAARVSSACLLCEACPHQHYRADCQETSTRCELCEPCPEHETRVNCRHDAGFNNAAGYCARTELLTYTPFCSEKKIIQLTTDAGEPISSEQDFATGLGGFSYSELFGVPNVSYIADFQCRDACVGVRTDTSYCGGPYACNTRVCSASYAQDGEEEYRQDKACPILLENSDAFDTIQKKRQISCVACDNCGDVQEQAFRELQNWGRGCANECSRLRCEVGQIFDFTDNACKACSQLTSVKLCPSFAQEALRNTDVSGHSILLQRDGCRGRPGQFDLSRFNYYAEEIASPDPQYGNCTQCSGLECAENEYSDTCISCTRCIHRDARDMEQRTWTKLTDGNEENLFCQLAMCPVDRTGINADGSMCLETCVSEIELGCTSSQFMLPCQVPHNTRCRPRWPAPLSIDAEGEAEDVLVAKRVTSYLIDEFGDSLDTTSFENVLVEVNEEPKHRHVCVWNAMDIRDSVARPAGISRTWLKPAASIDSVYGKTGTKFCHPIGVYDQNDGVSFIAWARDATVQNYPLLPLQNTITHATGRKHKYVLTNTSASVMYYADTENSEIFIDNNQYYAGVKVPPRPPSFVGDLFMALDLKNAVRADVAYQIDVLSTQHSYLFTSWVRVLAIQQHADTEAIFTPVAVNIGVDLIGTTTETITQHAWIDISLVASVEAELSTASASDSTSITITMSPSKIYDLTTLEGTLGSKLYQINHATDLMYLTTKDIPVFSFDGSIPSDSSTTQIITRNQYHEMHGSFVQARNASCGLVIATEREIICRDLASGAISSTIYSVAEKIAIVDFVILKDETGNALLVIQTVTLNALRAYMLTYVNTNFDTTHLPVSGIEMNFGQILTIAAHRDILLVISFVDDYVLQCNVATAFQTEGNWLLTLKDDSTSFQIRLADATSQTDDSVVLDTYIRSTALIHNTESDKIAGIMVFGIEQGLLVVDFNHNMETLPMPIDPVCKPSIAWLEIGESKQLFLLGVPCLGLLWRGSSTPDALQLRPIQQANVLRDSHFLQVDFKWWRIGVFTTSDFQIMPANLACPEGYGAQQEQHLSISPTIVDISWPCAWQCSQDIRCRGFDNNGQCFHLLHESNDIIDTSEPANDYNKFVYCPKTSSPKYMALVQSPADGIQRYMNTMSNFQILTAIRNFVSTTASQYTTAVLFLPSSYQVRVFETINTSPETVSPMTLHVTKSTAFTDDTWISNSIETVLSKYDLTSNVLSMPQFYDITGSEQTYNLMLTFPQLQHGQKIFLVLVSELAVSSELQFFADEVASAHTFVLHPAITHMFSIAYENTATPPEEQWQWVLRELGDIGEAVSIGNKLRMPSSVRIKALFTHPEVDVSFQTYVSGFTPTPNHPMQFQGISKRWHRLTALLAAAQASKVSRVQIRAAREPNPTNGNWASEECDGQLVVGVDALSLLAVLNEIPANKVLDRNELLVGIRVSDPLPTALQAVLQGSDEDNWQRLHVRALVLWSNSPNLIDSSCNAKVRVQVRSSYGAPNPRLHSLGCDIRAGLDECFFEIPLTLARNNVLNVLFIFSEEECLPALDQVFITPVPTHSTQYECPTLVQFWNADDQVCENCAGVQSICAAGQFRPGCEALQVESTASSASSSALTACQPCDESKFALPSGFSFAEVYEWSHTGTCMVTCKHGFTRDQNSDNVVCIPCSNVICDVGEIEITCTSDTDTFCQECTIPPEHGVFTDNEFFSEAGTCQTTCKSGHYRGSFASAETANRCAEGDTGLCNYSPCVPCSSLEEMQALLSLSSRGADQFFQFVPCTSTSDVFFTQCLEIDVDGVTHLPIADAIELGGPCSYQCPPGRYFVIEGQAPNIIIPSSQQPTAEQLQNSHASENLQLYYMHMLRGFCRECNLPWSGAIPAVEFEWTTPDTDDSTCTFSCIDPHVFWNDRCQICLTTCTADQYPGGEDECVCLPCNTDGIPTEHWEWNPDAIRELGNAYSCQGQCRTGFFRSGAVCLPKQTEPSLGCGPEHYWDVGSEIFDAACLPCTSCEGMYEAVICSAHQNAECRACTENLADTEQFVGKFCDTACRDGFIRNHETQECENCDNRVCDAGTKLADDPRYCDDCVPCPSKPPYSQWITGCEYKCVNGRILQRVSIVDDMGTESEQSVCAVDHSGLFAQYSHTAERKIIRCSGAEYLAMDYTCKPCTVSTPPLVQLNNTWQWLFASCKWECTSDRLLYTDIVGAKHCLTWQTFQASVLTRANAFNVRFSTIQHVVPRLSMAEILCCMVVLTVCVCLQLWI